MGSFFGNIGHAITKGVKDVGHAVGTVASNPLAKTLAAGALAMTGAGIPASMAIMGGMGAAGGALKPGGGLKQAVGGGVTGAATGALAGKLGAMAKNAGGVGGLLKQGAGTLVNTVTGGQAGHGGIADASVGGDGSGSGLSLVDRLKNLAGSVGSSLLGGGGGGAGGGGGTSLIDKLLMGGTVAAGAMDEAHKRGMQDKASQYATGAYDAKAPIRAQALAALAKPPVVDPRLAAASADPGGVYDRARRARMLAAAATSPAPVS